MISEAGGYGAIPQATLEATVSCTGTHMPPQVPVIGMPCSARESKKAFQFNLNISGAEYPLGTHSSSSQRLYFSLSISQGYPSPSSASPSGPCPAARTTRQVPSASSCLASSPASPLLPTGTQEAGRLLLRHLCTREGNSSLVTAEPRRGPLRRQMPDSISPGGCVRSALRAALPRERRSGATASRGTAKPGGFGGPLSSEMP